MMYITLEQVVGVFNKFQQDYDAAKIDKFQLKNSLDGLALTTIPILTSSYGAVSRVTREFREILNRDGSFFALLYLLQWLNDYGDDTPIAYNQKVDDSSTRNVQQQTAIITNIGVSQFQTQIQQQLQSQYHQLKSELDYVIQQLPDSQKTEATMMIEAIDNEANQPNPSPKSILEKSIGFVQKFDRVASPFIKYLGFILQNHLY